MIRTRQPLDDRMTNLSADQDEFAAPPATIQRALKDHESRLGVVPAVALEAMEMTKDSNCTISEFACLVERDARLATDILSFANSPAFSCGSVVTSIHHATVRLGLQRCRSLIMSACARAMMKNISMDQESIRELLWQHSFTTAAACLHLNRALSLGFQGEEFAAGLLHDFGRTLLAIAYSDEFSQADPLDFVESQESMERENAILGSNHSIVGAWYAQQQNLPSSLVAAMRWHHEPERVNEHQGLVALVAAADHIANHLQRGDDPNDYDADDNFALQVLSEISKKNLSGIFAEVAPQLIADIHKMASTDAN